MAKYVTPQMEKINAKNKGRSARNYSFWWEAWKRLKRNKTAMVGLAIILLLVFVAVFAKVIAPYDATVANVKDSYMTPCRAHLFGTDELGRDIFSRCVIAAQISLPMGILGAIASVLLGGTLGLIAAFFMGTTDNIIMRIMDVFQAIPSTLMAITVVATLDNGIPQLILAIALSNLPMFAKTVRSAVLTVRDSEFIEASRTVGASNIRLMLTHILPNSVGFIVIYFVSTISGTIVTISMLSYIGLGIVPPTPEWGSMLSAGRTYIQSFPHMVLFPGIMIMIAIFAFNAFGDGVRDALDPKLK